MKFYLNILVASLLFLPQTFLVNSINASEFLSEYSEIDLVITNGRLLDGLGNKAVFADLVIVDDEIVYVGKTSFDAKDFKQRIKRQLDAKQRIIAPGFIDLHTHGNPLKTPVFENFLAMGITTITLGQDGSSPEVVDLSNWLAKVEDQGISLNLAMFVGHGTLRSQTGINRTTMPSAGDLEKMLKLLDGTLKYTFGMSTGLEYNPGLNALEDEMIALAKVVGTNKRLIMSHLRNEDDDKIQVSLEELLKQGLHAKIHVSHLKSVYGKGEKSAEKILQILANARKQNIDVSADIYPYNASYAGISLLFPVWAKTTEQFNVALIERRAELESFLRNKIIKRNGPEATLLGTPPYTGKTLADISTELKIPFEQVLIKIGPKGASGAYFIMDDALQTRLLLDPQVSISSDGRQEGFHPRGHGAFAKIIEEYVIKREVLSLEEAVRKMTSQSANILGISDRGVLQKGYKADLVIFDPVKIKAAASYSKPHQLAQGFDVVIINGKIAREDQKLTEGLFGKVLKPSAVNK
ncbi:MAG: N-acyl-D-amino acid deacylase [Gammaproteobacteria bacterium]|nr:MAG: N-acyl-D-amino acid deacylase [Gammaproteobacteria bacterium]